jgi:glycosyltransferase involved in cell wall biosynthesis
MANYDLSILIPARNEIFLAKTVENILENIECNTEVIAVLDGAWAEPPVPQHERVTIIHNPQSIGQRAATNQAAGLSKAKYLMKCDAHCAFDKGFDIKMIEEMHDNWTMAPLMKNLHAFDWVCPDGHRRYQGPSGPCKECGKKTTRDILWRAKESPKSVSYCFDSTPHFQYFGEFAKRPEGKGEITETMSLQGSCWMLTRDKYWELGVCDEAFGSWGSQGIEVAVKTWLSGGRVMVNKKTWYAHMFRTQGGDFGFPYPISNKDQEKAKNYARDLFFNNNWPQQTYPLSWLVEKFWPVKGWTEEDLKKLKTNTFRFSAKIGDVKSAESEPKEELSTSGIIYSSQPKVKLTKGIIFYTDNQLKLKIAHFVQRQLAKISKRKGIPIVSASLKPMSFGSNIHLPLKRGPLTMFKQILAALEASRSDIIFFCEHDVLYHPSHFDFTPPIKDKFYYNENVWRLNSETGHALHFDFLRQTSGICVYRDLAIKHYRERIRRVEKEGFSWAMGFEPGTHTREARVDNVKAEGWKSELPNIDIRHGKNLSPTLWQKSEFRNQKFTKGWIETDHEIPGWGKTKNLIKKFK